MSEEKSLHRETFFPEKLTFSSDEICAAHLLFQQRSPRNAFWEALVVTMCLVAYLMRRSGSLSEYVALGTVTLVLGSALFSLVYFSARFGLKGEAKKVARRWAKMTGGNAEIFRDDANGFLVTFPGGSYRFLPENISACVFKNGITYGSGTTCEVPFANDKILFAKSGDRRKFFFNPKSR